MSVIEYMTNMRQRRSKPKTIHEHRGTLQDFVDLARSEAIRLGKRPVEEWECDNFSLNMFTVASDPKMLFRAWESLKGLSPGIDGISPRDIGRYVVYRKWLQKAKLFQNKAPAYRDTVFPTAPLELLFTLNMACQPEHMYRTTITEFSGAAPEFYTWMGERKAIYLSHLSCPGTYALTCTMALIKGGKTQKYHLSQALKLPEDFHQTLRTAGQDLRQLERIGEVVAEAIGKVFVSVRETNPRALVQNFAPLRLLKNEAHLRQSGKFSAIEKYLTWEALRWISDLLIKIPGNGKGYWPEELRTLNIPKPDGGLRTLSLPTAVDRIVAKSALLTIQPIFEQIFLPASVGCRSEKDRFDALAGLSHGYANTGGKFILCADVRKAFDSVRHADLYMVIGKYVKNPDMFTLLERIIRRDKAGSTGIGIPQGCPLSPLFLNILLHEYLDVPLQNAIGDRLIYYRYVDDLSIFGFSTQQEGEELIRKIQRYLEPIGLNLHTEPPKTQIVNLSAGHLERGGYIYQSRCEHIFEIDRYLGLGMRGGLDGNLEFFLPESWPDRIMAMFIEAEKSIAAGGYAGLEGAHRHIFNATAAWYHAFSPAWNATIEHEVIAKIISICHSVPCHTRYMDHSQLIKRWQSAYGWWMRIRACRTHVTSTQLREVVTNGDSPW